MLLYHQCITEEIKDKIEKIETKQKHDDPKPMGCSKSSSKKEVTAMQSYLRKQESQTTESYT